MAESGAASQARLKRIRFLSERGLRRASEALTGMLGYTIRLRVIGVFPLEASELSALAGRSASDQAVALRVLMSGQAGGQLLLLLPESSVSRILGVLVGRRFEPKVFSELERSALQEMGNILASSFMSELGDLVNRRFFHEVPQVALDRIPGVVQDVARWIRTLGETALVVQARIEDPAGQLRGDLFIIPEPAVFAPSLLDMGGAESLK
jgi:chemotaxis protein CheC